MAGRELNGLKERTAQLLRDLFLGRDVLALEEDAEDDDEARLLDGPGERVAVPVELLRRNQGGEVGEVGAERCQSRFEG